MNYFLKTTLTDPFWAYSSGTSFTSASLTNSPYFISAAGFSKDDISVEIKKDNLLHISGNSNKYGEKRIDTVLTIPENIHRDSIEVSVADGIITIKFEYKKEEVKKIKVK